MKSLASIALAGILALVGNVAGHYVENTIPVGAGPIAICYDSRDCKVYCASELTPTMTVIDGATNRVLRTIPIGYGAKALCYNPQNNKVYCACFHSYEVDVIDCSTDSCTPLYLGLYQSASKICYNSISNKVYCATVGGPTVFVIEGETDELLAALYAGSYPNGFGLNPVDNKVYCGFSADVAVIDGVGDTVMGRIPFGGGQWWSDYHVAGRKVYCANRSSGTVAVIDGQADSILKTITTGALIYGLVYNQSRNILYFDVTDSNEVKLVDASRDSLLPTAVPAGNWPWEMCYAREMDELYCADNRGNTVAVIDGSADTLKHLVAVGRKPQAMAWNPIYHRLYVANYDNATVSVIRDTLLAATEEPPGAANRPSLATIAGSTLLLAGRDEAVLLDISGRLVANLHPGANDIGGLKRGVYFVRGPDAATTVKVAILR